MRYINFFSLLAISTATVLGLPVTAQAKNLALQGTPITAAVFNCKAITPDDNYVNFESDPVRPLALSEDGKLLFVANTPANCLEIYRRDDAKLKRISAINVGLQPVAVAIRNKHEIWVVNHMSDSVSIVDIQGQPKVKQTLLVGDEPRDIVFAGTQNKRAFITTAHRGQNNPLFTIDDLRTPGKGRADVWVFNPQPGNGFIHEQPEEILSLFTDTPRALTVSADNSTVYAAGYLTGNQTTVIMAAGVNQPKAGPHDSADGVQEPFTALIVRYNGMHWTDELEQIWDNKVLFNLPDKDVFSIDANANPPAPMNAFSNVGTVLFNMAVNPASGAVYVSNTEARNEQRFEGPGSRSTTVRGHFLENRISIIKNNQVTSQHLNPHVDFSLPEGASIPAADKAHSLAQPMAMVFSPDGQDLYLAAFGSGKVARINSQDLETGQYDPYNTQHYTVPGGPAGLVMDKSGRYLIVYSQFNNQLTVIDTQRDQVGTPLALYNPEPAYIRQGRPFLYDANYTSSNGTVSCGGCHVFGDMDGLAWDLGNPDADVKENPLEESSGSLAPLKSRTFHPLKGPMTTQTFRGMALSGPMHWRGDRTGTERAIVNGREESQEAAAFKEFREAFVGLLGREETLTDAEMQHFTDFALAIPSYPNPIRNLDNSLTERQQQGHDDYMHARLDRGVSSCDSCHKLDPSQGLFGTDKKITSEGPLVSQDFKIPHLRNMYQKVGMFGTSYLSKTHMGDQIRGFGYGHDGTFASVDDFLQKLGGFFFQDQDQALRIAEFVFAFDTEQAPATGQQITLNGRNFRQSTNRINTLLSVAEEQQCDLVASGVVFGYPISARIAADGMSYSEWLPVMPEIAFRQLAIWPDNALTYTCLPKGSGHVYGKYGAL